jgi:hypothetical protein
MLLPEDQQALMVAAAVDKDNRYAVLTEPLVWSSSDESAVLVSAADPWGSTAWLTPVGPPRSGAIIRVAAGEVIAGIGVEVAPSSGWREDNAALVPNPIAAFDVYPARYILKAAPAPDPAPEG